MAKAAPLTARNDRPPPARLQSALAMLHRHATKATLAGMARFGLPADRALGVPVHKIHLVAKSLGRDQALAEALWHSGVYEARLLAAFVGEPEKFTSAVMDRWSRSFDNWAVVDTVCFKLFDQSPQAWGRIGPWTKRQDEFQCRAGYVLLACLAAHAKAAPNEKFLKFLPLIERGAADERNFVKKGVSWALRMIGRRSPALNRAARALASRLAKSEGAAARWIGRGAGRELARPAVVKRAARNGSR